MRLRDDLTEDQKRLVKAWDKAITEVDAHSRSCKQGCHRRIPYSREFGTDPYQSCARAKQLEAAENEARRAYLSAGGKLPTRDA